MSERRQIHRGSKALARLLRFALAGPMTLASQDGDDCHLLQKGGAERRFSRQVVEDAVSRGLLQRAGEHFKAAKEARSYLRRLMAAEVEDEFLDQHRDLVEESMAVEEGRPRRTVRRNRDEQPLAILSKLRDKSGQSYFSRDAIEAGERLAADFYRGGLQPSITASWQPRLEARGNGGAGGIADLTEAAIAARIRVARAIEAMGPDLAGVALDVCCFTKGLELVERERLWPARSAKLMLRTALSALARHYQPPHKARSAEARHWGADDYRPQM